MKHEKRILASQTTRETPCILSLLVAPSDTNIFRKRLQNQ